MVREAGVSAASSFLASELHSLSACYVLQYGNPAGKLRTALWSWQEAPCLMRLHCPSFASHGLEIACHMLVSAGSSDRKRPAGAGSVQIHTNVKDCVAQDT